MIIAVNTRFLVKDRLEGMGDFTREVFKRLAKRYPQHQFYFLFDQPYSRDFIFPENIHPLVVSPPARHPILWKYWFDIKLPLVLKKIKADVFVSLDGFCSLTTKIPQCLMVHDLGFLHQPEAYKKSQYRFYKRFTPKFLKKAKAIATLSQFSKEDIVHQYKIDPQKISVVYHAVKEVFRPTSFDQQVWTREKYTEQKAFFLYAGAMEPRKNLVNLLKAFSVFKKRQQSEMKLVLCGSLAPENEEFLPLLKTYKYRDDVVLANQVSEEEVVQLMGAAYALVYPSLFEGFGLPVLEAMKCGVPVLTSVHTSMQEMGEDGALYFRPDDHTDMADKLMLIYKDENLRSSLIAKGKVIAAKYTWERTAGLVWESIVKATEKS